MGEDAAMMVDHETQKARKKRQQRGLKGVAGERNIHRVNNKCTRGTGQKKQRRDTLSIACSYWPNKLMGGNHGGSARKTVV